MRLTLRTLLAWTDGVLPAADREDLDPKIAASKAAGILSQRIAEVIARPGLRAPSLRGRGLGEDANSVADYLDNVLPADNLENFERICLESDIHLAETAACHRLLAEFIRQPHEEKTVMPGLRRRLLAAVGERLHAVPADPRHDEMVASAQMLREAIGATEPAVDVAPRPIPRRSRSLETWVSASAAIVLLAALAAGLAWSLLRGRGRAVATRPPQAAASAAPEAAAAPEAVIRPRRPVESAEPDAPDEPGVAAPNAPPEPMTPALPAAAVPGDQAAPAAAPAAVATPVAPGAPAGPAPAPAAAAPAAAPAAAVADGGEAAAPAMVEDSPFTRPAAPAAAVAQPAAPPDPIDVVEPFGLLCRDGGDAAGVWRACRKRDKLAFGVECIAPPDCFPDVAVGGLAIRLHPCSRLRITRDADGTPRVELLAGRAVVLGTKPESAVGITAGGLTGVVHGGIAAPLGVELAAERNPGRPPDAERRLLARIVPSPAGFAWRQTDATGAPATRPLRGLEPDARIPGTVAVTWSAAAPEAARLADLGGRPDWLTVKQSAERIDREAARVLASRLADRPDPKQALGGMLNESRSEHRTTAAVTLAMLGDPTALVDLLVEDSPKVRLNDRQWMRFEELAVPAALAADGDADTRLRQALAARDPNHGAELWRLVHRLGDDELAAGGAAFLVAALESPQLALRRYAFVNLLEIVPASIEANRYHPERAEDRNRDAVKWWRSQLAAGRISRHPQAGGTPPPPPVPAGEGAEGR